MIAVVCMIILIEAVLPTKSLITSPNAKRIIVFGRTSPCTTFTQHLSATVSKPSRTKKCSHRVKNLYMKDLSSSYWFQVDDKVRVTSSVIKAGVDLKNRIGVVTQTWEKCDVDPTCCCAEFVDDNYAVQVKFTGPLDPEKSKSDGLIQGIDTFVHYFNENELTKVVEDDSSTPSASAVAFDGMSCTAFKLDQLKMGEQAQRITAFEASKNKKKL